MAEEGVCGGLEDIQYIQTAKKVGVSESRVRACVREWILERPLTLLREYRYPYIREFCLALQKRSVQLAVFSDYPAMDKIKALGLPKMLTFCSTEKQIDVFKPSPKGLLHVINQIGAPMECCILIGDRDDRDGECARRAGIRYLLKGNIGGAAKHQFECYSRLLEEFRNAYNCTG